MATSTIKGINKTEENITGIVFKLQNGAVYVSGARTIVVNAGQYAYIGTLSEPFRPKSTLWIPIAIDPNASRLGSMMIAADGRVSLLSNVTITSSTTMTVNGSYSVL